MNTAQDDVRAQSGAASRLPLVVQADANADLRVHCDRHAEEIQRSLLEHGAVLLRGFTVNRAAFSELVERLWGARLDYTYRSTPRSAVADKVYTATLYPANRSIPLHCEEAYQTDWPLKIAFYCEQAATLGGETPLADMMAVTRRLDPALLARFRERGVQYVRTYAAGIDLPWTEVFQTHSRVEVERYCAVHDIEFSWRADGSLQTRQRCQGTARHPQLGLELFFNQAHLFHISSLGTELEAATLAALGESNLPRNAYFGDGAPIPRADLEAVRAALRRETVVFSWRNADVLLLDNMQVAHGRSPFKGARSVLVAMSQPYSALRQSRTAEQGAHDTHH
jgi:alpha-ketoglutarate-dependent taurine dioxygenase